MTKITAYMNKKKKALIASFAIGLLVTILTGFITKDYSDYIQNDISQKIIRLHVLANSDSNADQQLKLKVKDRIVSEISALLDSSASLDESRDILTANLNNIQIAVAQVIYENGSDYNIEVSLQKSVYFPTKNYGDVSFPAGKYEALQIKIGEAKGKNWWCVLFPPLCFIDSTHSIASDETKSILKESLTEEEYNIISNAESDSAVPYKVRFKVVEIWQKLFKGSN